jgi:hypothetical protein
VALTIQGPGWSAPSSTTSGRSQAGVTRT